MSRLPAGERVHNLLRLLRSLRLPVNVVVKARSDRLLQRGAALAFQTLLSVVPLSAVGMAAVRRYGGEDAQEALLKFLVERYVPAATGKGIDAVLPLVRGLDLNAVGLVGLAALLPLMLALVDAVELTFADIFGTARRGRLWRFTVLGSLLTLAPFGAVLTVRYGPWHTLSLDALITPLLLTTVVMFLAFRYLPHGNISDRAALTGALLAGVSLAVTKAGFGLYATYLGLSIHIVFGAIAFLPLLLLWVLTAWMSVLLGAEVATVLHRELRALEAGAGALVARKRRRRTRVFRRVLRRR